MGAAADRFEQLLRASFPAHLFTPNALAFFRGVCMLGEQLEANTDAAQAQAFIDTATDIWLRVRAQERGVPYTSTTGDELLREALRMNRDTVTPNGMLTEVLKLATYADTDWSDQTAEPAEYFEHWNDGAYANATGSATTVTQPGQGFANARDCIAGHLGTTGFEFVLPGLDLENGNYAHPTGALYGSPDTMGAAGLDELTSAFAHGDGAVGNLVGITAFATGPDYDAWDIANQIAAHIESWRAYGVPAYAQLRQTPDGGVPDPFFRQGLTLYSTGGTVAESFADPFTDGLESDRCLTLNNAGALAYIMTDTFEISEAGEYRIGVSARSLFPVSPTLNIKIFNATRNEWWLASTRQWKVSEEHAAITLTTLRDRQEPLILVPLAAGDEIQIKVELPFGSNTTVALYHVGMFQEAA